jgi:hypothetical protein
MKQSKPAVDIEQLRAELREVRQTSLNATRQGDYRTVARLTARAAAINKAIMEAESLELASH